MYLSLASFVKRLHKSCKVRLFSGYHHPSRIIDRSGRWFSISPSPASRLLLFYLRLLSPMLGQGAAPKAFQTKPFAACWCAFWVCSPGVCFRDFLFWGFSDLKQIPGFGPESHNFKLCNDQSCSSSSNNKAPGEVFLFPLFCPWGAAGSVPGPAACSLPIKLNCQR